MSALDHWLNVLDIALKAKERSTAERRAAREAARGAREHRTFNEGPRAPKDPNCCLAKRRFDK